MHLDRLQYLLRLPAPEPPRRTADCPDELKIAAYVDGTLEGDHCERLELHLADCDACIALVGLLSRQRESGVKESVPELAVARARSLVKPAASRWTRYAPHWAAAAMVVFSVAALVQLTGTPEGDSQPPPVTRTAAPAATSLQLLHPYPGVTVETGQLVFRWTEIPGSHYYDVRIVTDAGDLVSEARVEDTEWRPPGDLALRPGAEYYVHVDAYPSAAKTLSSDHVPFTIAE